MNKETKFRTAFQPMKSQHTKYTKKFRLGHSSSFDYVPKGEMMNEKQQ